MCKHRAVSRRGEAAGSGTEWRRGVSSSETRRVTADGRGQAKPLVQGHRVSPVSKELTTIRGAAESSRFPTTVTIVF